jgi:hypothetical protein
MSNTNELTVANTILAQLGGNRFLAMTGSKNLVGGENYLSMKLGKGADSGITHMTITLRSDDTYDVLFQKVRGNLVKEISKHEGVYVDMLSDVIYNATGFYTSL